MSALDARRRRIPSYLAEAIEQAYANPAGRAPQAAPRMPAGVLPSAAAQSLGPESAPPLPGGDLRGQLAQSLIGASRSDSPDYGPVMSLAAALRDQPAPGTTRNDPEVPGVTGSPRSGSPVPQVSLEIEGKVTPTIRGAVQLVQQSLGTPYVWGGSRPGGFDCSGLLQWAWGKTGVRIPRVTYDQWRAGRSVPRGRLQAGDAVFFRPGSRGPEHVGMYIGGGRFIEAPGRGKKVRISNLAGRSDYMGARRYR